MNKMNSEGTPLRATKGRPMSASLKERLKRCGRYHVNSPVSVSHQKKEVEVSPYPAKSFSPSSPEIKRCSYSLDASREMNIKVPTKRKIYLCADNLGCESSETVNLIPLKKNVVDDQSDLCCSNVRNTCAPVKDILVLQKLEKNSSSQHNNSDITSNNIVSTGSSCNSSCTIYSKESTFGAKDNVSKETNSFNSENSLPKATSCGLKDIVAKATRCESDDGALSKHIPNKICKSQEVSSSFVTHPNKEDKTECNNCDPEHLDTLSGKLHTMEAELKEKQELLRKLKMVKMYREKNDLTELQILIDRWRRVSQTALSDLLQLYPEPRPQLSDLITHLQIDPELVKFDREEQDFCG